MLRLGSPLHGSLLVASILLAAATVAPTPARAGGLEYIAAGTRALGRGGAFMARADDGTALRYNPAALANLSGYQLSLGSNLAFYDACVQRSGGYDDSGVSTSAAFDSRFGFPDPTDPNSFASMQFPRICRGGAPGPSPQLVFSMHPTEGLGIAFGILAPAGVGSSTWGNPDGSIDVNGINLPSPVRYQIVRQSVLLFHPSIGVGYSPIPEVSFGATFQWGISIVDFTTMTNIGTGAQDPATDGTAELNLFDPFVPAVVLSVHVTPIDALDIVVTARMSDAIDADGSIAVTTGAFGTAMDGSYSPFRTEIDGTANLRAGQPWEFGLAVRYADRINPRSRNAEAQSRVTGRIEDSMQNERFDLELDLVYTMNSQVTDFVTTLPDGSVGICEGTRNCAVDGPNLTASLPSSLPIAKGWRDQISVRVGADWNVLPGLLTLRAGGNFESSGMNPNYQGPDFMPGMRIGLHLGATVRVERFDFSVAYAHIFQFDHTVTDPRLRHSASLGGAVGDGYTCEEPDPANPGSLRPAPYDPARPVVNRGCYPRGYGSVVNAGTYSAEYNIVSANVRYHFE